MWYLRDMGRYGEIWGDRGRYGEMHLWYLRDRGRYGTREIWEMEILRVEPGRYGEILRVVPGR